MIRSDDVSKLIPALFAAQGDIKAALKDSKNEFFKSEYSDYNSVLAAIKEPLRKQSLFPTQFLTEKDGKPGIETTIWHVSGQFISEIAYIHPGKNDPQGWGGAWSYLKRYGLKGPLMVADADDDANYATHGSSRPQPTPQPLPRSERVAVTTSIRPVVTKYLALDEQKKTLLDTFIKLDPKVNMEKVKKFSEHSIGKEFSAVLADVAGTVESWGVQQ